jgi:hypothetical protein
VKVRLGLLREYLYEAVSMTRVTSPSAPTDRDAAVPGHLPNELPGSAALDDERGNPPQPGQLGEEAWVPGRWFPNGLEAEPYDHDRLGSPDGMPEDMDETDDRMVGDGKGNGIPDPEAGDDDLKMSPHLKGDEDKTSLGDVPEEKPDHHLGENTDCDWLASAIRSYMQQKPLVLEYPAGAGMVDPIEPPKGFYSDFDMSRDHHDGDDIHGFAYNSPARPMGTDGDPRREEDPQSQLRMHVNGIPTTAVHPSVSGEEGWAALKAPEIPSLTGGSDTSATLGANAYSGGVESGDGSEEGEEGEEDQGGHAQGDEGQGDEQV